LEGETHNQGAKTRKHSEFKKKNVASNAYNNTTGYDRKKEEKNATDTKTS